MRGLRALSRKPATRSLTTTRHPPRLALLGVPYDYLSSYLRGAAAAPDMIREAFLCDSANTFSESRRELRDAFVDMGNVDELAIAHSDPEECMKLIEKEANTPFSLDFTVVLSAAFSHYVCAPSQTSPCFSPLHFHIIIYIFTLCLCPFTLAFLSSCPLEI